MESARFDRLARLLGATTSRRAGIGIAVAALTGATIAEPASAATTCRRGRQTCQRNNQCCSGVCQTGRGFSTRERNRCTCEDGLELCNNACVDTDTDARHCGACGNRCGSGDHCVEGRCRIHQQCYSSEAGFCYMTPNGREYRAEGVLIAEAQSNWVECLRQSDCTEIYDSCALPGVNCVCARAVDTGSGYDEAPVGRGVCLPILDSGDSEITCEADAGDRCFFTADGNEVKACYGRFVSAGPCDGYSCDGVGICDEEGASCICALAEKNVPWAFYVDIFIAPTCFVYSATDGLCPS